MHTLASDLFWGAHGGLAPRGKLLCSNFGTEVRPHYGQARQKDITLGDVLDAVNRDARTTKLCDAANTIKDLERRVAKLESLVAVGIVLSGILALSITQPGAMNKLETDQSGLDTRLLIVEDALDISPLPIARSASRPTR